VIKYAASALAAALIAGCGASAYGNASGVHRIRLASSPTPSSVSSGSPAVPVAIPTCTSPEVEPDFWTPYCGDAGYQLADLNWDVWTARTARADGIAAVTHGDLAGQRWRIFVAFDRSRHVAGFKPRTLFSRAVVHYLDRPGPNGGWVETIPLREVWETAKFDQQQG
jgi:hypothetical protein